VRTRSHGGREVCARRADAAGAAPLLIPSLADELGFDELLQRLDGLLFTGSPSNVEPHRYAGAPSAPGTLHDRRAMRPRCPSSQGRTGRGAGVGICRGFQEMNVRSAALCTRSCTRCRDISIIATTGRNRWSAVRPGSRGDARARRRAALARGERSYQVNSLHNQGIDRLGAELRSRRARRTA